MFGLCIVFSRAQLLAVSYITMLLHECAHMAAAIFIGLKIDKIVLYPFGVNLKLKNKIVYSLADELILYMSGPLFNALTAFVMMIIFNCTRDYRAQYLYFMNIVLFVFNMLPVVPLDGGFVLKRILSGVLGARAADKVMKCISGVLLVFVLMFCIWSITVSEFNFSVIMIAVFLAGSIFTGGEKYNSDFLKELMFAANKEGKRVRHIMANENEEMRKIAQRFTDNAYTVVYLTDENGKIINTLTERQIIDRLL